MVQTHSVNSMVQNAIVQLEELCLALFTSKQGGRCVVSDLLPIKNYDSLQMARSLCRIIGTSSECPCTCCGGVVFTHFVPGDCDEHFRFTTSTYKIVKSN